MTWTISRNGLNAELANLLRSHLRIPMAQKILLVEDDPINVKFIEVVLTRMGGYDVVVSEDVEEILALAKGGTLAGIIMDISLARSSYQGKKVDGIFITKLLKADPETAQIPVLMATAHAMYGDREKFSLRQALKAISPSPSTIPIPFSGKCKAWSRNREAPSGRIP